MSNYEMTIYHGESLKTHIENTLTGIDKERFIASQLRDYLNAPNDRKVCCLYGLRRTGKTTMMLQEIERIGDYDKCLLLHCESGSSVMQIRKMIEAYPDSKYIFVDEATKAQNFISTASVLSDNYAAEGKKIILAGTDSLGFALARKDELYDRVHFIHTTYIPFREQHKLLGTGIMDYIRYGGTLSPEGVFYNKEQTGEYSNSAIVFNITHSLERWNQGRNNGILDGAVRRGDLPSYINKVLEYNNRQFLASIINSDFKSHDIGSLADLLTKSGSADPELLYPSGNDEASIKAREDLTDRIRIALHIKENPIPVDPECVQAIIHFLKEMDVLYELPEKSGEPSYLFTQSGMRYSQAKDEAEALLNTDVFRNGEYSMVEQKEILDKLEQDISGHVLEDIVLYQAIQSAKEIGGSVVASKYEPKTYVGEFDVFFADLERRTACAVEVKLSDKQTEKQVRHLTNKQLCEAFEKETGAEIQNKIVLYQGKSAFNPFQATTPEDKVLYMNVETFLKQPEQLMQALLQEPVSDKKHFQSLMKAAGEKTPHKDDITR